jgi:hypothetical protein
MVCGQCTIWREQELHLQVQQLAGYNDPGYKNSMTVDCKEGILKLIDIKVVPAKVT